MKKIIAISLLAAAVLMLAACGSRAGAVSSAADAKQTQEMQTQETQVQETQAQEPQITEVDAQEVYQSLEGYYQDSVSQRARMDTWQTDDGLAIRVSWASSSFQESEWNMTAVLTEDNKLEYTDCTRFEITYLENNAYDSKEVSSNQKGYFTIEDGKLLWNGAADEACKACVFERMPEDAWPQSWEPEYTGVYWRTWSEEIIGTVAEMNSYIVLAEDRTGYWIEQDVGMLTWDESQLMLTIGLTYDIALTQENDTVNLLVYESQDETGVWVPTVFEKIEELPAEMEKMLPKS